MIEHQTNAYQWEFIYLGANQDAVAAGAQIGEQARSAMTYSADAASTSMMFGAVNAKISRSRSGQRDGFSEMERSSVMPEPPSTAGKKSRKK